MLCGVRLVWRNSLPAFYQIFSIRNLRSGIGIWRDHGGDRNRTVSETGGVQALWPAELLSGQHAENDLVWLYGHRLRIVAGAGRPLQGESAVHVFNGLRSTKLKEFWDIPRQTKRASEHTAATRSSAKAARLWPCAEPMKRAIRYYRPISGRSMWIWWSSCGEQSAGKKLHNAQRDHWACFCRCKRKTRHAIYTPSRSGPGYMLGEA